MLHHSAGPRLLSALTLLLSARGAVPLSLPIHFEENIGQTDAAVLYRTMPPGRQVQLKARGLSFPDSALEILFESTRPSVKVRAEQMQAGRISYLGARSFRDTPLSQRVSYNGI